MPAPKANGKPKTSAPETPVSDGLVEVHMCGPSRELLEVIRIDPEKRRHGIAWQGHHYAHFDTVANDVWRYCQVD